jgi:hypothetical protein
MRRDLLVFAKLSHRSGGRGHFQWQSPLHILGQFSAIPEPSIGSAGNPSPAVFCVGVRE